MEPILSSATHHAVLFALLARQIIETFGEPGKTAVLAGVNRYGEQRGRRMALRTLADGDELSAENYLAYGEWLSAPGENDLRFPAYEPEIRMESHRCPWYSAWEARGLLDYGSYYCRDVDAALARGYNGMTLRLLANRTLGDPCCSFLFQDSAVPAHRMDAFADKKQRLGSRAKMPWPYHVGHLYNAMRTAAADAFGEEGVQAVRRGLSEYGSEFGEAAQKLVLEYADMDYDALPPYEGISP